MAADSVSKTSTARMRQLQLNDKIATLNRQFVTQLKKWMEQTPHYDFTETVNSYLQHMEHLKKIYCGKDNEMDETLKSGGTPTNNGSTGRVIAKAKRRSEKSGLSTTDGKISTPTKAPPRISSAFGDVSAISAETTVRPTVVEDKEEKSSGTPVTTRGKRAIRGGGPLGGAESVVLRGSEAPTYEYPTFPKVELNLPKPSADFWKKKSEPAADSSTCFNFLKSTNDTAKTTTEPKKDEPEAPKDKPFLSFSSFGKKPEEKKEESTEAKKPAFSFPSFGNKDIAKPAAPATFGSGFSFSAAPSGGASKPLLSFGSLAGAGEANKAAASSSGETNDEANNDDENYVPPKTEVVEKEEAGSVYSTKCSVFKWTVPEEGAKGEYTKLGVGMLHFKDVDDKKSILVRAATTIGTVWVNAALNKSIKVTKAPASKEGKEDKLNLVVPVSATECRTFLIRFATTSIMEEVKKRVDAEAK